MANAQQDYRMLQGMFGPGALSGGYNQLYKLLLASPYGQNALSNASIQGQNFSQNLTQNLAHRGLTGTGIGTIASTLGQSMPGFAQQQTRADLSQQAFTGAQGLNSEHMQAFINLLLQHRQHVGWFQDLLGKLVGGGSQIAAAAAGK